MDINYLAGANVCGCIKTWRWKLPEKICGVPRGFLPELFYCRECRNREFVVYKYIEKYLYEKYLFVCPKCGNVHEVYYNGQYNQVDLHTWPVLRNQPYYWRYFSSPGFAPGNLAYDYIHCGSGIIRHPLIETHCTGNKTEAAETIVRFLIHMLCEGYPWGYGLFLGPSDEVGISWKENELIISSGETDGKYPEDEFAVIRESENSLLLEYVSHDIVNSYGYTLDLNEEDFEESAEYVYTRITFVSEKPEDLPEGIAVLDHIPTLRSWERKWIAKGPFGLNGYFLFEKKLDETVAEETPEEED